MDLMNLVPCSQSGFACPSSSRKRGRPRHGDDLVESNHGKVKCRDDCGRDAQQTNGYCNICNNKHAKKYKKQKKLNLEKEKIEEKKSGDSKEDDEQLLKRAKAVGMELQLMLPIATRTTAVLQKEMIKKTLQQVNENIEKDIEKANAMLVENVKTLQEKKRKRIEIEHQVQQAQNKLNEAENNMMIVKQARKEKVGRRQMEKDYHDTIKFLELKCRSNEERMISLITMVAAKRFKLRVWHNKQFIILQEELLYIIALSTRKANAVGQLINRAVGQVIVLSMSTFYRTVKRETHNLHNFSLYLKKRTE